MRVKAFSVTIGEHSRRMSVHWLDGTSLRVTLDEIYESIGVSSVGIIRSSEEPLHGLHFPEEGDKWRRRYKISWLTQKVPTEGKEWYGGRVVRLT